MKNCARRPAAIGDTDVLYANLMGILSEMGRIDDASRAAREALPIMHRVARLLSRGVDLSVLAPRASWKLPHCCSARSMRLLRGPGCRRDRMNGV